MGNLQTEVANRARPLRPGGYALGEVHAAAAIVGAKGFEPLTYSV
jgi:hypothetical protein